MTKTEAKTLLSRDYIPDGQTVPAKVLDELHFRRTGEYEVHRCGAAVGYDPQSGSLFCGDVAEFAADVAPGVLALCEKHHNRLKKRA